MTPLFVASFEQVRKDVKNKLVSRNWTCVQIFLQIRHLWRFWHFGSAVTVDNVPRCFARTTRQVQGASTHIMRAKPPNPNAQ